MEDQKGQVNIVKLQENQVDSVEDVLKLIQHGNAVRYGCLKKVSYIKISPNEWKNTSWKIELIFIIYVFK